MKKIILIVFCYSALNATVIYDNLKYKMKMDDINMTDYKIDDPTIFGDKSNKYMYFEKKIDKNKKQVLRFFKDKTLKEVFFLTNTNHLNIDRLFLPKTFNNKLLKVGYSLNTISTNEQKNITAKNFKKDMLKPIISKFYSAIKGKLFLISTYIENRTGLDKDFVQINTHITCVNEKVKDKCVKCDLLSGKKNKTECAEFLSYRQILDKE
jgi:MFS superfamily sulfate permease-like transporter